MDRLSKKGSYLGVISLAKMNYCMINIASDTQYSVTMTSVQTFTHEWTSVVVQPCKGKWHNLPYAII